MKIKYLGSADRRSVPKGTNANGRLAEPFAKEVVWDHDNHFLVDTEETELTDEQVQVLLEDPNFKDVTDLKMIPQSIAEQQRTGKTKVAAETVDEDGDEEESSTAKKKATRTSGGGAGGGGATAAGGSTGGAGTTGAGTTVGGSTAGGS